MDKSVLEDIQDRLRATRHELALELDRQLADRREQFRYELERGKVRFDRDMGMLQKTYRTGLWRYIRGAPILTALTAPIIYGLVIPLALLDVSVTIYQQICFRVYGIELVRRGEHVVIDRHHLAYLNLLEKFNCVYCGYGNGVISYAREIAGRTEEHFCPIKHARRAEDPHDLFAGFTDYGDADAYRKRLDEIGRSGTAKTEG